MGRKLIDLTGKKFGMLTVVKRADDINGDPSWYCNCDCGTKDFVVRGSNLRGNRTRTCGCERINMISKNTRKNNAYDLTSKDYGIGYTSKGEEFYFDLEDYNKIKDYCWHMDDNGYIRTRFRHDDNNANKLVRMHKLILDYDGIIDHKNCNKSDNRKENLRLVTNSQNCTNKGLLSNNTSGVTGVYWEKNKQRWFAEICINYKRIRSNYFKEFTDAVNARKKLEDRYYGEYKYNAEISKGGLVI